MLPKSSLKSIQLYKNIDGAKIGFRNTPMVRFFVSFAQNKAALIALLVLVIEVLFCFVGPLIYTTDQFHADITSMNLPPSSAHPLGTGAHGFDVLGRLMEGGQNSLIIGVTVAIASTFFGMLWGAISGFMGGIVDAVMSRILDVLISMPAIFLFIYLATVFEPTIILIIVVLTALSWLIPARLVRGETLSLRTREYIQASRIMGASVGTIVWRHIFRNVISTLVVNATFQVAYAILILATLNYFGFGLQPPTPSWGGMLTNGMNYMYAGYWWGIYPPAAMIVITVIIFSLIGDGLRDAFEVRLQVK